MRGARRWIRVVGALVTLLASASAFAPERAPAKPNVVVLATGGTIAGAQPKPGEAGYKAGAFSVGSLIQAVPGMRDLAGVSGEQIASNGNQDMNDEVWIRLARRVNELQAPPDVAALELNPQKARVLMQQALARTKDVLAVRKFFEDY